MILKIYFFALLCWNSANTVQQHTSTDAVLSRVSFAWRAVLCNDLVICCSLSVPLGLSCLERSQSCAADGAFRPSMIQVKVRLDDRRFESRTLQLFKLALFLYSYVYPKTLLLEWNLSLQETSCYYYILTATKS